jgi:hypothetical protein
LERDAPDLVDAVIARWWLQNFESVLPLSDVTFVVPTVDDILAAPLDALDQLA